MLFLSIGKPISLLKDHDHYVQGVSWDPQNGFIATQSSDRTCKIYTPKPKTKGNKDPEFICSYTIGKRMLKSVSDLRFDIDGETVKITCSIGGATTIPDLKQDRSDLIRNADTALYYAKEHGRNQFYSKDKANI